MTANSETTLVFHVKSLSLWDSNMTRIMSNFMLYILYSKLDIMCVMSIVVHFFLFLN